MSRYPVQYNSKSKGPTDIEEMKDTHLCNTVRKIERAFDKDGVTQPQGMDALVYGALVEEMGRRGLSTLYKSGRPPQEQPPLSENERELAEWANQPEPPADFEEGR